MYRSTLNRDDEHFGDAAAAMRDDAECIIFDPEEAALYDEDTEVWSSLVKGNASFRFNR